MSCNDRRCRPAGPPPDAASLHEAALAYLARYAATEALLRRVLDRRVDRWARAMSGQTDAEHLAEQVAAAKQAARAVVARLAAVGAVNDVTYAEGRARNLSGRGARAMQWPPIWRREVSTRPPRKRS